VSRADCFRTLGVDPDASWEGIRQAYKDLVRVWHPDRFQSDPELQHRAEQQLQKINEAYFALKNSHSFEGRQPEPAPQPEPACPGPAVSYHPRPGGGPDRFAWDLQSGWPIKAAWAALICLVLLVIGFLVNALGVPSFRKSIVGERPSEPLVQPAKVADPPSDDVVSGQQPHPRTSGTAAPGPPANGTELLPARTTGGSQLWVTNMAGQDAVATLVDADTASPVRIVYIQANNKVCIRHIAPGLYDLLAQRGETWDPAHLRFQTGRHALEKNGPFQCIDLTVEHVTSGRCIEVSSTEGASRPKSNIVLGAR